MITLTKLNGTQFVLNSDLIEVIQENPDTTIRLTNGSTYIVEEPMEEVVRLTLQFRRKVFRDLIESAK
jgi:flagellar protein FlbD